MNITSCVHFFVKTEVPGTERRISCISSATYGNIGAITEAIVFNTCMMSAAESICTRHVSDLLKYADNPASLQTVYCICIQTIFRDVEV